MAHIINLLLVSLFVSVPPYATNARTSFAQGSEITERNWQTHPKIKAVRQVVQSVDANIKRGALKITERKYESCADQYFTMRRIARDAKGVTRWYRDYSEGEDSSFDFNYYYDANGKLRFVFATVRAANGTREQLRIYFDDAAHRLWKSHKPLAGPGCPGCFGAFLDSDAALVFEPDKAFADDSACKPIK